MGNNPSKFQDNSLNPVERLSWKDAQEFCQKLSEKTGKKYRLPTEAGWEYACHAETTTSFHFGETINSDLANYRGTSIYSNESKGEYRGRTTPVGYFNVANNFGLYDMHGNVWEWCEDDWHENYLNAPNDGRAKVKEKSFIKVVRGGSFGNSPRFSRSAYRLRLNPDLVDPYVGFRLAIGDPRSL